MAWMVEERFWKRLGREEGVLVFLFLSLLYSLTLNCLMSDCAWDKEIQGISKFHYNVSNHFFKLVKFIYLFFDLMAWNFPDWGWSIPYYIGNTESLPLDLRRSRLYMHFKLLSWIYFLTSHLNIFMDKVRCRGTVQDLFAFSYHLSDWVQGAPSENEPRRVAMPSYGPDDPGSSELALCIFQIIQKLSDSKTDSYYRNLEYLVWKKNVSSLCTWKVLLFWDDWNPVLVW